MKILSVSLKNFASYKELDFTFDDRGLTLIHGSTGSGKSTLADAIPWVLFGTTAKGGPVSDVLSWSGEGATVGTTVIEVAGVTVEIARIRGKTNDLFYSSNYTDNVRGKDIPDTQKLINNLLGLTPELYLSAAYYHEFSQTAQFFTTTAKNRRTITEQLVDLSLPKKLQEKVSEQLKANKQELAYIENELKFSDTAIKKLNDDIKFYEKQSKEWSKAIIAKETQIRTQVTNFEIRHNSDVTELNKELLSLKIIVNNETYLKDLQYHIPPDSIPCKECGVPKPNPERELILTTISEQKEHQREYKEYERERNRILKEIDKLSHQVNPYKEQLSSLDRENPHTYSIVRFEDELKDELMSEDLFLDQQAELLIHKTDLEVLEESVATFRSILIKNTILDLEDNTNRLLNKHFDGEIRIELTVEDNDKLEVSITKDGNIANFTQLSKGQRCMLKLTFAIAVMKAVQNHHGISLNQLWFDESLDGLDDNNKLKAVHMLEQLSLGFGSIYLVEHSETVKALVDNKIEVELVNGQSQIEKT